MARPVPRTPMLPQVPTNSSGPALFSFLGQLNKALFFALSEFAQRINLNFAGDGSEPFRTPLPLQDVPVADLPDASLWEGAVIYVPDETGGATLAFSDGTDWLRAQDRAVVS